MDTVSFSQALKSALRQDPDVILVGEMRDLETIETALTAAETGHLVMSTLHTLDATETINRIVSVFPPYQQKQVRLQLASGAQGGRSPSAWCPAPTARAAWPRWRCCKITARVRELIEDKDRTKEIPDAIAQGHQTYGMQTFDQSLMSLVRQNIITYEEAHRQATNPDDFALRFSGISATSDSTLGRLRGRPGRELGAGQRGLHPARVAVGGTGVRSRPDAGGAPSGAQAAGHAARAHQSLRARGAGAAPAQKPAAGLDRAPVRGRRLPHRAVLSAAGPSRLAGRPGTSSARWRLTPARRAPAGDAHACAGR